MQPLVVINTVGLTVKQLAHAPRLRALADAGWSRPLQVTLPAVTCASQTSMLTGKTPAEHGIVGNGWLFRDTMEVRFWQQSNHLVQAEPVYQTARRLARQRDIPFRSAKLFWWFNQGAAVDVSVTPKPHYGADGGKAFDILSTPEGLAESLKKKLGDFPFFTFWGPNAGLPCTQWIARCAADILNTQRPELSLVYLPHLDYDTQRQGPAVCDWKKIVGELDDACEPLLEAAKTIGARVWVVNEYSHIQVDRPLYPNRELRQAGLLKVRSGPFGEMLDLYASRAFAVCDHQLAHIYVNDIETSRVRNVLEAIPGIERIYAGDERAEVGMNHPRSGELIALARPDAWFAYPYWTDDKLAPDFARTVDIHRKPGFDPCELFLDPSLLWPKGRIIRRLIQKKLGMRTLFDVIPLEAKLVGGSHGIAASDRQDWPVLIADGPEPAETTLQQTAIRNLILKNLGLEADEG